MSTFNNVTFATARNIFFSPESDVAQTILREAGNIMNKSCERYIKIIGNYDLTHVSWNCFGYWMGRNVGAKDILFNPHFIATPFKMLISRYISYDAGDAFVQVIKEFVLNYTRTIPNARVFFDWVLPANFLNAVIYGAVIDLLWKMAVDYHNKRQLVVSKEKLAQLVSAGLIYLAYGGYGITWMGLRGVFGPVLMGLTMGYLCQMSGKISAKYAGDIRLFDFSEWTSTFSSMLSDVIEPYTNIAKFNLKNIENMLRVLTKRQKDDNTPLYFSRVSKEQLYLMKACACQLREKGELMVSIADTNEVKRILAKNGEIDNNLDINDNDELIKMTGDDLSLFKRFYQIGYTARSDYHLILYNDSEKEMRVYNSDNPGGYKLEGKYVDQFLNDWDGVSKQKDLVELNADPDVQEKIAQLFFKTYTNPRWKQLLYKTLFLVAAFGAEFYANRTPGVMHTTQFNHYMAQARIHTNDFTKSASRTATLRMGGG